jgi:hypothetical protein
MEKYIGYVRTSTGKQNLGLEEQQSQIIDFVINNNAELIEIIIEQESGKNNIRRGLDMALEKCSKHGYTLLFTKLDRLTREVEFLFAIRNRGVKLRCIALPELNTLTLGIFGTKTKTLGTIANLTNEGRQKGSQVVQQQRIENENWRRAKTFVEHFQMKNGYMNLTEVSNLLNENGYKTRRGCSFSPITVKRLIA